MFLKWIYLKKAYDNLCRAQQELIVAEGVSTKDLAQIILTTYNKLKDEQAILTVKFQWTAELTHIESCGKQFIIVFANGRRELRAE